MNARFFLVCGLTGMVLAVTFGAFGAHAIKDMVSTNQMITWQTASEYHFYHALGLIGLAIWIDNRDITRLLKISGICLLLGIILFSGSLYLMVLTGNSRFGMITPIGGLFFILGWSNWLLSATLFRGD